MARTQARILTSIWNDDDFRALPPGPQRTYMFLLSQPNLSHAGLLPLTVKRWARASTGLTVEIIEADLAYLAQTMFVVIDHDTEELLVRTLVKNDGVWRQPKVMPAMAAAATEITSSRLRVALRVELSALDLSGLKDETRAVVAPILERVLDTLPDTPPDTHPDTVSAAAPGTVSDTPTRDARAASAPKALTSTTSLSHKPVAPSARKIDPIWDALMAACELNTDALTATARGAYNAATKQLRDLNVPPEEIHRRAAIYRAQWRDVTLTPTALVRRWAECERPPPTATPMPSRNAQILAANLAAAEAFDAQRNPDRKALG